MKIFGFWAVRMTTLSLLTTGCVMFPYNGTFAQNRIVPDRSLGEESSRVVRQAGSQIDLIRGGARRESALFHSFNDFNVELGGEATFANPKGVTSIFSRVTGPLRSDILGTLGVEGNADLVLLNPNGVYFGPQSRVDIAGSLLVSADSALDLGDGAVFRADTSAVPSLLTMRVPIGVQLGGNSGTIVNRGVLRSGQDLTFLGDRLDLSGEIFAKRDLSLRGNQVVIREGDRAFIGAAGRTLRIEGRDRVDIDVLGFSESGLFSGGDLLLRSAQPIVADARFSAGRHLRFEGLKDEFGDVISRTNPVILANGDVTLETYEGASLHILAGGSVRLGDVTITESGPINSTINPKNQTPVNEQLTYGDLASFEVSGFELKKNQKGDLDQIPTHEKINVDGHQEATLDIRAGVDWKALGGLPNNLILGEVSPIPDTGGITNSAITISGNVRIKQPGGRVLLTNRFSPNGELNNGAIRTQRIDTSVEGIELDAGDVSILGRGEILTSFIDTSSTIELDKDNSPVNSNDTAGISGDVFISSLSGTVTNNRILTLSIGNLGKGGDINVSSVSGDVNNENLRSISRSDSGNSGQGGDINVSSISGNINNKNLRSISRSEAGNSAQGGDITVFSVFGNIKNDLLRSTSVSESDQRSDQGGDITVSSVFGNINNKNLKTTSSSKSGKARKGGDITVSSDFGYIKNLKFESSSISRYGIARKGGDIMITSTAQKNDNPLREIHNQDFLASSFSRDGNAGRGGNIMISSGSANIRNEDLRSASSSRGGSSGQGGDIMTSSISGNIESQSLRTVSVSLADVGSDKNAGQGGNIKLSSTSGDIQLSQDISTFSYSRNGNAGSAGNIRVQTHQGEIIGEMDNDSTRLMTFSIGAQGSQDGGKITLLADKIKNLNLLTLSSRNNSGDVRVEGQNKLLILQDLNLIASATTDVDISSDIDNFANKIQIDPSINDATSGKVTIASPGDGRLESVTIRSDSNSGIPAGDIEIRLPGTLRIKDSEISTNANNTGNAGNINVKAREIILDKSSLTASTSGISQKGNMQNNINQGNINIDFVNLLLLMNSSLISAQAERQAAGGNIVINSLSGFVLGLQSQGNGNDIIASAEAGMGGNITINAQEIFGFPGADAVPGNSRNDIDASSNSNLQGVVSLNTPGIEPNEKIPSLIMTFSPPKIQDNCQRTSQNTFVNINRGGKVPALSELQTSLAWDDSRPIMSSNRASRSSDPNAQTQQERPIAEAQRWIQNDDGHIHLIAPYLGGSAIASNPSSCKLAQNSQH